MAELEGRGGGKRVLREIRSREGVTGIAEEEGIVRPTSRWRDRPGVWFIDGTGSCLRVCGGIGDAVLSTLAGILEGKLVDGILSVVSSRSNARSSRRVVAFLVESPTVRL